MKQAIITIFLSVLTFVLCACSGDGITDTYWRDDKTGEWLIGLTEDKLVMSGTCSLPSMPGIPAIPLRIFHIQV